MIPQYLWQELHKIPLKIRKELLFILKDLNIIQTIHFTQKKYVLKKKNPKDKRGIKTNKNNKHKSDYDDTKSHKWNKGKKTNKKLN